MNHTYNMKCQLGLKMRTERSDCLESTPSATYLEASTGLQRIWVFYLNPVLVLGLIVGRNYFGHFIWCAKKAHCTEHLVCVIDMQRLVICHRLKILHPLTTVAGFKIFFINYSVFCLTSSLNGRTSSINLPTRPSGYEVAFNSRKRDFKCDEQSRAEETTVIKGRCQLLCPQLAKQ